MLQTPRIYVDTSTFGGSFDEEFSDASIRFFSDIRAGKYSLVTSIIVEQEISTAPLCVQELFDELAREAEIVDVSNEALILRDAYISMGIVSSRYLADALHVALATTTRCDLIISWNFKHIVNFRKIQQYNAVNALHGYSNIGIYSPLEVVENESEDF